MEKDNENAKDERWIVPVTLHGVKPEDYDASIESANGSANYIEAQKVIKEKQKKQGKSPIQNEEI